MDDDVMTNWAGNVRFTAQRRERPTSLDELRALVGTRDQVHALGSRHSFSAVADSPGSLVVLDDLPPEIDVDSTAGTVRVGGGVRYAELGPVLDGAGLALPAMASLPHITVVGACATGTHGSGSRTQSLAATVTAVQFVDAEGNLVEWERGRDPEFPGSVVALGALGIVTAITIRAVPAYLVAQSVYEGLPFDDLCEHLEEIQNAVYSVSVFTDWNPDRTVSVWFKQRNDDGPHAVVAKDWFAATPADADRHPVPNQPPIGSTAQLGRPGPWYDRLPHFRADHQPSSSGREIQSEYLVARADGPAALRALDAVRADIHSAAQTCEIRSVAADDLWLSPFYEMDAVGLHFTWVPDVDRVAAAVSVVETALAPLNARPHWGKVFATPPSAMDDLFPRLDDFRALVRKQDPGGKFGNPFLRDVLGVGD